MVHLHNCNNDVYHQIPKWYERRHFWQFNKHQIEITNALFKYQAK